MWIANNGVTRSGAGSNPLSSVTLRQMQKDYRSGTNVRLPSGIILDTRVVISQRLINMRGQNNQHLPLQEEVGQASTIVYHR